VDDIRKGFSELDPNVLLTVDEFAQVASCGRQAVYKMIERGFGPAVLRYGEKTLRFRVQDVRDWVKKQTVQISEPTSESVGRVVAPRRSGRRRERDRRNRNQAPAPRETK